MKHFISTTLLILAFLLPTSAFAHDFEVDGIYYRINGNNAIVTYKGSDYNQYSNEYSGNVSIPSSVTYYNGSTYSVTAIDNAAFSGCSELISISIPYSVTSIGSSGLSNCSGLTSITVASGNNKYDSRNNCNAIIETASNTLIAGCQNTVIPNSVSSIGKYAFSGCSGLTSIDIPNSVTEIGDGAFDSCSGLTNVNIPNSVTSIGDYTFWFCSGLTSIYIPNSVTSIGNYTFASCSGLTSVNIPNSVTSIGDYTFWFCSELTSVTIPKSVIKIGSSAFSGCSGLLSISVENENIKYDSRNNCNAIIETTSNTLIAGCQNTIIPNSVISIGDQAFYYCHGLTNIYIPNSVIHIGNGAFFECRNLSHVDTPDFVVSIGSSAFGNCSGLTDISIPNSVTSIGNYAFSGCSGLTSVTIPDDVTTIGDGAFTECTSLSTLNFNAVYCADFNEYLSDYRPFSNLNISTINIGDNVQRIPAYFAYGLKKLTNMTIPNSVTSIGKSAFYGCTGLTGTLTIPNSVSSIGDYSFDNCTGLTNLTIGNSVTKIGDYTFYGCSGLTSVNIPNNVTSIGKRAFSYCSGLTNITIPNSVTSIDDYAFASCSNLFDVYSYIIRPSTISVGTSIFTLYTNIYLNRTLHVPHGSLGDYLVDENWEPYFGEIVEINPTLATGIDMSQTAASLVVENTLQLVVTVLPEETTNKNVTWTSSAPDVANVDGNGLVTALASGTAIITATTTDGSNLSASCVVTVTDNMSEYDNYLSIADVEAFHGDTIVIPIKMTNTASIISFQTDIVIPDGLELLQEDGEYLIDPSDRMTRTHSLMSNDISGGAIRVICYSSNYKPFTGNSGDDLFYITVKVTDDAEGDYTIRLRNTLFTTIDFEELTAPDVAATIHVKSYLLGDANGSGTVTVTDVVVTSQYILEMYPQPFVFEAADVNTDGTITVTDVSRIAWMVLNPSQRAPLRAPVLWNIGDRMSCDDISLAAGETRKVSIMLDNEMDYSSFQFDLYFPAGLTASNFQLTDRADSHVFDVNTLQNGKIRALCYSPNMTGINGHEGALLTFDVTAAATITGNITVNGIELVTPECQTVKLDAFTIGVSNASSVKEVASGRTIAKVEYFNLAGQQITEPTDGVTLIVTTYTDGTSSTNKIIR